MAIIKVKTGGITADAITDALIADDVVGTEHLTANEVDTTALGADAVTGAQLADNAVNSEHYTDGSVDTAHIADAQITTAKLSTAVLTGATDIGAAIADADLFLVDDGAGGTLRKTAASRLKTYVGSNTPAFRATSSGGNTVANQTYTKLTFDTEAFDTDSDFASSRFTPQVAGKYLITAQTRLNSGSDFDDNVIAIYKNGSISSSRQMSHFHYECNLVTGIFTMNGSSDYVEVYFFHNQGGDTATDGGTTLNFFEGFRIIT